MPRDLSGRKGRTRFGEMLEPRETTKVEVKCGPSGEELLDVFKREYLEWDEQTWDDRDESIRWRDFYDGIQWTASEIDKLNKRKQPILTKNLIAPKINYIAGTETDNRVTPVAKPRTNWHDMDGEVMTDGLRFAVERDHFDVTRSATFMNVLVEGYGGAVFQIDKVDRYNQDPDAQIHLEHVEWDRIYYDPRSRKPDFSDAKYLGMIVWMHEEDAREYFIDEDMSEEEQENVEAMIQSSYARDQSLGDSTQDAPRRWQDSTGRVQWFETYRHMDGEWYVARWSWAGFIEEPEPVGGLIETADEEDMECLDEDNTPFWGFVDEDGNTFCPMILYSAFVDRNNARYSPIKNMLSPQEEVNKRISKSLHLLHTKSVIAEEGAIQDPDTFMANLMKADGLATVAPGRLRDNTVQVIDNTQLAMAQLQMSDRAEAAINSTGPRAALVDSDQRVRSGTAFMARQEAGSKEIKPVFDSLYQWTKRVFERYWWLIRINWTEEKWLRIRDDEFHQEHRFIGLNRESTKGERIRELIDKQWEPEDALRHIMGTDGPMLLQKIQQDLQKQQQELEQQMQQMAPMLQQAQQAQQPLPPEIQQAQAQLQQQAQTLQQQDPMEMLLIGEAVKEPYVINDVAKMDLDIVIDTAPYSATAREQQFGELVNLISTSPVASQNPQILALMFENSNLRTEAKRAFVQALVPPPSPEQQQMEQAQQQAQMKQMEMSIAQMQATVQKLESEAMKNQALAQKTAADAQKVAADAQVAIPAAAQLDQAQAALAASKAQQGQIAAGLTEAQAQLAMSKVKQAAGEAALTQAQTLKTSVEADAIVRDAHKPGNNER